MKTAIRDFWRKLKGDGLGAKLARGASGTFLVHIAGAGLLFGLHVFLARVLGVDQYGIFAYVTMWLSILVLPCKMGIDTAFIRFLPEHKTNEDWGRFHGDVRDGFRFTFFFSVCVAAILAASIATISSQLKPDLRLTFFIGAGVLPFMAMLMVSSRGLQALKQVVLGISCMQLLRPMFMIVFIGLTVLLLTESPRAPQAMVLHLLAYLAAWLIAVVIFLRTARNETKPEKAVTESKLFLRTAAPMLAINIFFLLNARAGSLITGAVAGTTEAGIFVSAMRVAQLLTFGLIGVNAMVAPMISELYAGARVRDLQRITVYAAFGISAFTLPVALIMITCGPWIMALFGPEFTAGYPALVILAAGQAINALAGSVGFLMTMTGHQNQAAFRMGGAAILNIVLCFAFVPWLGAAGAAIGTATGTITWNIALYFWVRKNLNIDPTVFGIKRLATL